jgi:hypothetical protein
MGNQSAALGMGTLALAVEEEEEEEDGEWLIAPMRR